MVPVLDSQQEDILDFGLPGGVSDGVVNYVDVDDPEGGGMLRRAGDHPVQVQHLALQVNSFLLVVGDFEKEGKNGACPRLSDEHNILLPVEDGLDDLSRGDAWPAPESLDLQVGIIEVVQHGEHLNLAVSGEVQVVQVDAPGAAEGVVTVVDDHHNIAGHIDVVDLFGLSLEGPVGEGLERMAGSDVHVYLGAFLTEGQHNVSVDGHLGADFTPRLCGDGHNVLNRVIVLKCLEDGVVLLPVDAQVGRVQVIGGLTHVDHRIEGLKMVLQGHRELTFLLLVAVLALDVVVQHIAIEPLGVVEGNVHVHFSAVLLGLDMAQFPDLIGVEFLGWDNLGFVGLDDLHLGGVELGAGFLIIGRDVHGEVLLVGVPPDPEDGVLSEHVGQHFLAVPDHQHLLVVDLDGVDHLDAADKELSVDDAGGGHARMYHQQHVVLFLDKVEQPIGVDLIIFFDVEVALEFLQQQGLVGAPQGRGQSVQGHLGLAHQDEGVAVDLKIVAGTGSFDLEEGIGYALVVDIEGEDACLGLQEHHFGVVNGNLGGQGREVGNPEYTHNPGVESKLGLRFVLPAVMQIINGIHLHSLPVLECHHDQVVHSDRYPAHQVRIVVAEPLTTIVDKPSGVEIVQVHSDIQLASIIEHDCTDFLLGAVHLRHDADLPQAQVGLGHCPAADGGVGELGIDQHFAVDVVDGVGGVLAHLHDTEDLCAVLDLLESVLGEDLVVDDVGSVNLRGERQHGLHFLLHVVLRSLGGVLALEAHIVADVPAEKLPLQVHRQIVRRIHQHLRPTLKPSFDDGCVGVFNEDQVDGLLALDYISVIVADGAGLDEVGLGVAGLAGGVSADDQVGQAQANVVGLVLLDQVQGAIVGPVGDDGGAEGGLQEGPECIEVGECVPGEDPGASLELSADHSFGLYNHEVFVHEQLLHDGAGNNAELVEQGGPIEQIPRVLVHSVVIGHHNIDIIIETISLDSESVHIHLDGHEGSAGDPLRGAQLDLVDAGILDQQIDEVVQHLVVQDGQRWQPQGGMVDDVKDLDAHDLSRVQEDLHVGLVGVGSVHSLGLVEPEHVLDVGEGVGQHLDFPGFEVRVGHEHVTLAGAQQDLECGQVDKQELVAVQLPIAHEPAIDDGVGRLAGVVDDLVHVVAVQLGAVLHLHHLLDHDAGLGVVQPNGQSGELVVDTEAQEAVVFLDLSRGEVEAVFKVGVVDRVLRRDFNVLLHEPVEDEVVAVEQVLQVQPGCLANADGDDRGQGAGPTEGGGRAHRPRAHHQHSQDQQVLLHGVVV